MSKPIVLILCTGKSNRILMAESILRNSASELIEVVSAGSNPSGYVHPKAITALDEIGIDITSHTSKHMNDFLDQEIHTVITVCGNADQECPTYPGQVHRHHWGFEDPAHAEGSEEEIMEVFRKVRNEIQLVFEAYAAGIKAAS